MITPGSHTFKKKLRYFLMVCTVVWSILTMFVAYDYILFSSTVIGSKGGTFVEGVVGSVSVVPYLDFSTQSRFYQSLLFQSCLDYRFDSSGSIEFVSSLCDVRTTNNTTFTVRLTGNAQRADGKPVSITDLFFTYNTIIKQNKREIPQLDVFSNITITQPDEETLLVEFPRASRDNYSFFLNFILPAHILTDAPWEWYADSFAKNPLGSACGTVERSLDPKSLIVNTTTCKNTFASFYQVKLLASEHSTEYVDMKAIEKPLDDDRFTLHHAITNTNMGLFFNTKSKKLSPRIQRALGGLIVSHLYTGNVQYLLHRNHLGLDAFLSQGDGIRDFIVSFNPNADLEQRDLELLDVQPLPSVVPLIGDSVRVVYQYDFARMSGMQSIRLDFREQRIRYTGYRLSGPMFLQPITFRSNQQVIIPLYRNGERILQPGRSFVDIVGLYDTFETSRNRFVTRERSLGRIDIYAFDTQPPRGSGMVDRLYTFVYLSNPLSQAIVARIKDIFVQANIDEFFSFVGYENGDEYVAALGSGTYDLALRMLDLGAKADFSSIFLTDEASINPSRYVNERLVFLLQNYTNETDITKQKSFLSDANIIYANDLPVVFLGNVVHPVYLRTSLASRYFRVRDEYVFRRSVFDSIRLVTRLRPDLDAMFSVETMKRYAAQF
ncbi:MAG: hypothetical protein NZL83_00225 [Candidatus Absconditabacterales bacterium]|nr:hypothetical protein [Candidatus Absconditabacterales bacterium]